MKPSSANKTSSAKPKVVSADEVEVYRRNKTPYHLIMEQIGGDWWTYRQTGAWFGVNAETLRKLKRDKKIEAPKHAASQGKMVIWLWDMDDVLALEKYYIRNGYDLEKKIDPKKTLAEQSPE